LLYQKQNSKNVDLFFVIFWKTEKYRQQICPGAQEGIHAVRLHLRFAKKSANWQHWIFFSILMQSFFTDAAKGKGKPWSLLKLVSLNKSKMREDKKRVDFSSNSEGDLKRRKIAALKNIRSKSYKSQPA
jgi:hypothetical protein